MALYLILFIPIKRCPLVLFFINSLFLTCNLCHSVRFLTGHSRNGGPDPLYVAENAADPDTTLVVYMGLSTLPSLAPKLMKHGLPPDTPAVAVERGTTPQQRMVLSIDPHHLNCVWLQFSVLNISFVVGIRHVKGFCE